MILEVYRVIGYWKHRVFILFGRGVIRQSLSVRKGNTVLVILLTTKWLIHVLTFWWDLPVKLKFHSKTKTNSPLEKHRDNLMPFGIFPTYGIDHTCAAVPTKSFLVILCSNRQLEPPLPLNSSYRIFRHSALAPNFCIHPIFRKGIGREKRSSVARVQKGGVREPVFKKRVRDLLLFLPEKKYAWLQYEKP